MKLKTEQFSTRAPTMDNAAAVTGLINVCAVMETGAVRATVPQIYEGWRRSGFDLHSDARLVVGPRGRVVGYAEVWDGDPDAHPCFWSYVHPDYVTQIGPYLLGWAEERARRALANAPEGMRVALRTGVLSVNRAAWLLLAQGGFRLVQRFWCAAGALDASLPALGWPDCVNIKAYALGQDYRALFRFDVYEKELHPGAMPERRTPRALRAVL